MKKKKKPKKPKVRIPVPPPTIRHKSKKDYKRVKKVVVVEDETGG